MIGSSLRAVAIALLLALLGACSASEPVPVDDAPPPPPFLPEAEETVCTEPRPQICTMDYRPVCGRLANGEWKTFPNGCGACGDANVVSHVPDACPGDDA